MLCTRTIFIGIFNLLRASKFTMSTIANEDFSFSYTYTESQSCSRGFCRSYWASEDGAICRSADSSFNKIQWNANDRNDCDLKVLGGSISCSVKCGGFKDLSTGAQAGRIVAVVIGIMAVIAYIYYRRGGRFVCKKKQQSNDGNTTTTAGAGAGAGADGGQYKPAAAEVTNTVLVNKKADNAALAPADGV